MSQRLLDENLPSVTDLAFDALFYVKEEIENSINQYFLDEIDHLLKEMIILDNDIKRAINATTLFHWTF